MRIAKGIDQMKQAEPDEHSPGHLLRELLIELYPFDPQARQGILSTLDDAVKAEGMLTHTTYLSAINYLLRRLVTSARFIYRKYYLSTRSSTEYLQRLRQYLKDNTDIPHSAREKVFILLQSCVEESESDRPTQNTKNRIRKRISKQGQTCYICGKDFGDPLEVEHIWPKTLGGSNIDNNLTLACPRCNRAKDDFVDGSDFHYEEISLVSDDDDINFETEFNWVYRVAVLAKHNYCCSACGKPVSDVGELVFSRRDPSDSWHYLNIDAYCSRCRK